MKISISTFFMESMTQLPKSIQKKAIEFVKKFEEDSKSHAIHLEPISTFKDANLRTARIDLTYRAVLRMHETGNHYFLLWVDHHDKAMDWAKNKTFEWNREIHRFQIYSTPILEKEEPTKQASAEPKGFFAQFSKKDLLRIGVPEPLMSSILEIENLDGLEAIEKYLPQGLFEKLFDLFDGTDITIVVNEVAEGKNESDELDAQMNSANNRRHFVEPTNEMLDELLSGTLKNWRVFLHESQRTLVEKSFKSSVKISGGAGTGKTVAALHRAKYLQDNDLGRNAKPILFTTYTKSLTRNLRDELPGMGIDSGMVKVINIDAFVMEEAKRLSLFPEDMRLLDYPQSLKSIEIWEEVIDMELTSLTPRFLEQEYKDVLLFQNIKTDKDYFKAQRTGRKKRISRKDKMEIWRLKERYEKRKKELSSYDALEVYNSLCDYYSVQEEKPFGHIIADEIQDFSNVHLRLLRSLVAEKPNDLFLVGDPMQKIYKQRINFSKAGIHIRGVRSRRLKINYRTTEEIKRAAIATLKNISFDNFDGEEESKKGYISLFHGTAPNYQTFRGKAAEADFIMAQLQEYLSKDSAPIMPEEICIAARTKNGYKDIKSKLHRENYPYYDVKDDAGNRQGIRLSTFHSIKGLEFKVVFLIDLNSRNTPFKPASYIGWDKDVQKEHDDREKALLYVAMTRAIQILQLTGTGSKSDAIEF